MVPQSRLKLVLLTIAFLLLSQPFHAALIPPFFLDCVVALGRKDRVSAPPPPPGVQAAPPLYGPWIFEASGFLYGKFIKKHDEQNNEYHLYLVTNRHVIQEHEEATKGAPLWVRFNSSSPGSAREYDLPLRDAQGKPLWHFHPNAAVDIAVIPVNADFLKAQGAKFDYFKADDELLTRTRAKDLGLSEGAGIYVLGFPMGLIGQREDYVIVRQGALARVRDVLDSPAPGTFLIDSFIFPGNSGGPVILRPEMVAIQGTKAIEKAYLLGMVKSYLPYTDYAISPQTKRVRVSFEENSGLAEVIPAEFIQEAIDDAESQPATR
jgi:S1-C subfamily serine protease